jgi:hypothetical protein
MADAFTVDGFTFAVEDHDKLQDTIDTMISDEAACHFCQGLPITVVYRGWDDKVVMACKAHEEIVLEMIERAR